MSLSCRLQNKAQKYYLILHLLYYIVSPGEELKGVKLRKQALPCCQGRHSIFADDLIISKLAQQNKWLQFRSY